MSLKKLVTIFDRSVATLRAGLPIRKTNIGIWVPTPLPVIMASVSLMEEMKLLGRTAPPGAVIDAGMGDGRVAAALAYLNPSQPIYGLELDPVLFSQAVVNWRELRMQGLVVESSVQMIEADYCDLVSYKSCGLNFSETCVILNYPDGNQGRLANFVAEHGGSRTSLCLLTHDHSVNLDTLELCAQREVQVTGEINWLLSVYRRSRN
jgi:hypothetical protein